MTTNTQPQTQQNDGDELHTDAILHVKDPESVKAIELMAEIHRIANPHIINVRGKDRISIDLIAVVQLIQAREREAKDKGAIEYRDHLSTFGYPLSDPPRIIKQPVPCPRCGAEEYADWTLYPHQLYNSYMPGGIGHYCFPCFAAIVAEKHETQPKPQAGKGGEG